MFKFKAKLPVKGITGKVVSSGKIPASDKGDDTKSLPFNKSKVCPTCGK